MKSLDRETFDAEVLAVRDRLHRGEVKTVDVVSELAVKELWVNERLLAWCEVE